MADGENRSASGVRVGTSAFTAAGWEGSFYPAGMSPRDYLSYYATQFDTVEIDSSFYRTPSLSTVKGWYENTPANFLVAAKIPQAITHEKILVDCDEEFEEFVSRMVVLKEKLGPLLLQFPYFNKLAFKSAAEFLNRLRAFLKRWKRRSYRMAVEIRNKSWLNAGFAELLREYDVALVLQDQAWMPRPGELFEKLDPITADFTYVRLLGHRKRIEEQTKTWDRVFVNRTAEVGEWVRYLRPVMQRGVQVLVYVNNHYSGHAPATAEMFRKQWGGAEASRPDTERRHRSGRLFE